MKSKNFVAAFLLIAALGVTSCTPRNRVSTDSTSSSGNSSQTSETTDSSSSTGTVTLPDNPYSTVLEGLDQEKANTYITATDLSGSGYVDGDYAYGWCQYSVEAWGGATYGAAVRIQFNEDHAVTNVEIGASSESATFFTSSYASGNGYESYMKMVYSLNAQVNLAIRGLTPMEILTAFEGLKIDDTGGEGMSNWTTCEDEDYAFIGTGATQTDTRIQKAIYNATVAYCMDSSFNTDADPFWNSFATELGNPTSTSEHVNDAVKTSDGAIGYYLYNSWGSDYGAAVKLTVDSNNVITSYTLGKPTEASHNFTPMYIGSNPSAYLDYLNINAALTPLLVGKTCNAELADSFAASYADSSFTVSGTNYISAGATQSCARTNMSIVAAIEAILAA